MIALKCVLARLTSAVDAPAFAIDGREQILRDVFASGSNGDIQLEIDNAAMAQPMGEEQGFWALDLHLALRNLTQNPAPPARSQRIAVLFADFYRPFPPALGVMFDRGFDPGDDPSSATEFRQSPREGCAVFLRAITDLRQRASAQVEAEALFTTIHELGHVFNLQHAQSPANFLAQSPASNPYPPEAYFFLPAHKLMLANCSKSANVWPGGEPFGDTGVHAHHSAVVGRASPPPHFGLELAISMGQREFWSFEPVELDIELRVARGVPRSFRVPDALDPGYETFDIWIEDPTRERRRYRSPRRYCGVTQSRTIRRERPFRRDISIFGEAGGYTFRKAGVHRLWAEFTIKPGLMLRSNDLEVSVRPADDSAAYGIAGRVLTARPRARLLYHRLSRRTNPRHLRVLKDFCDAEPALQSLGSIRYAVARVLAERASVEDLPLPTAAAELLRRACDSPTLGDHQRGLAERLLERRSVPVRARVVAWARPGGAAKRMPQ